MTPEERAVFTTRLDAILEVLHRIEHEMQRVPIPQIGELRNLDRETELLNRAEAAEARVRELEIKAALSVETATHQAKRIRELEADRANAHESTDTVRELRAMDLAEIARLRERDELREELDRRQIDYGLLSDDYKQLKLDNDALRTEKSRVLATHLAAQIDNEFLRENLLNVEHDRSATYAELQSVAQQGQPLSRNLEIDHQILVGEYTQLKIYNDALREQLVSSQKHDHKLVKTVEARELAALHEANALRAKLREWEEKGAIQYQTGSAVATPSPHPTPPRRSSRDPR